MERVIERIEESTEGMEIRYAVAVSVTLRELRKNGFDPQSFGYTTAEHEKLLDDPGLLRVLNRCGWSCEERTEIDEIDVEVYEIHGMRDMPGLGGSGAQWHSLTNHATSSQADLREQQRLLRQTPGLCALFARICPAEDAKWLAEQTENICTEDCCNYDECFPDENEDDDDD